MENRKIVDELINLPIGEGLAKEYKQEFTWDDLLKTKGVLPTDIVWHFFYKEEKESGMFSLAMEDELRTFYYPIMQVCRRRPETDEEYLSRKQKEQSIKNVSEEKERLEYLRLKAKFETTKEISQ